MFKIYDGRDNFFQWDLNQRLIVADASITEVHFCNRTDDCALVCEVYEEEGLRLVDVPNILLQEAWDIRVYGYCDGQYTKHQARFKVAARSRPADYIYTETELKNYDDLEDRIKALEAGGGVVYLTKEEANYNTIKSYIDAGKEVVIINEESGFRYYLKKYDGTSFIFSGDILGEFFSLVYNNPEEEPEEEYTEYLTETTIEDYVDNYYNPTGSSPISGTGVAEALATVSTDYELIGDMTLPEDSTVFSFTELLNGKSFEDYKDFFMYFYGKFTADFASPNAIAIRANEGAVYFMWRGFGTRKADSLFGFWCEIEEIYKNEDMRLWKTTDEMLYNIQAGGNTQGLSDNNNQVYGDFALTYVKDFALERIQMFIGSNNSNNTFKAGSRCMLFGRLR